MRCSGAVGKAEATCAWFYYKSPEGTLLNHCETRRRLLSLLFNSYPPGSLPRPTCPYKSHAHSSSVRYPSKQLQTIRCRFPSR